MINQYYTIFRIILHILNHLTLTIHSIIISIQLNTIMSLWNQQMNFFKEHICNKSIIVNDSWTIVFTDIVISVDDREFRNLNIHFNISRNFYFSFWQSRSIMWNPTLMKYQTLLNRETHNANFWTGYIYNETLMVGDSQLICQQHFLFVYICLRIQKHM